MNKYEYAGIVYQTSLIASIEYYPKSKSYSVITPLDSFENVVILASTTKFHLEYDLTLHIFQTMTFISIHLFIFQVVGKKGVGLECVHKMR